MENKKYLNIDSARTKEQKDLMKKIEKDGVCPFCVENFAKYHPKEIIKETPYWFLTENISPYDGVKHHFLFVYKKHITTPEKISNKGRIELFDLIGFLITNYGVKWGSFFMRFGNLKGTGSSVGHLHAQLISGDIKDKNDKEAIKIKLGWKVK